MAHLSVGTDESKRAAWRYAGGSGGVRVCESNLGRRIIREKATSPIQNRT